MTREQIEALAETCFLVCDQDADFPWCATTSELEEFVRLAIEQETPRIRAEALQDAAAYVLANAKIKNSCCAETRASIYTLIKGMTDD